MGTILLIIVILAVCGLAVSKESGLYQHVFKIRSGVAAFATLALVLLSGMFLIFFFTEKEAVLGVSAAIGFGLALLTSARFWVPRLKHLRKPSV